MYSSAPSSSPISYPSTTKRTPIGGVPPEYIVFAPNPYI